MVAAFQNKTTVRRAILAAILVGCLGLSTAGASPPSAPVIGPMISPHEQTAVLSALIAEMNRSYVFPDVAKRVEAELKANQRGGVFKVAIAGPEFAKKLTNRLREIAGDKHLGVRYVSDPIPISAVLPAVDAAKELAESRSRNFSVTKVERLDHNIGYINVRGFDAPAAAAETIAAAMRFVTYTDALIIDLRENGGGYPDGVAQLESYFFDTPTHLNDMKNRAGDVEETWTLEALAGPRFGEKRDVYLLTSANTFSGGEDMAYTMQQLKRATIVGEVTGGGANPGQSFRLSAHFSAFIPFARAVNPISKTNWEGKGVQPDISVPADKALKAAQLAALRRLLATASDDQRRQRIAASIADLERAL